MPDLTPNDKVFDFLQTFSSNGELSKLLREFDWSKTALGEISTWPQSLKTAINIILNSQHPMFIAWGKEQIFIYNDAYIQILSRSKHPWALGRPFSEVWSEIWDVCGPLADKVFQHGEPTFADNVRLFMQREGDFLEEGNYCFSYSPIRDESGEIAGLFCPSASISRQILMTRRVKTLGELSSKTLLQKTINLACASAIDILATNPDDFPFALLYLTNPDRKSASLIQATGLAIPNNYYINPESIDLTQQAGSDKLLWPIAEVIKTAKAQKLSVASVNSLPLGLEKQRIKHALIFPLNTLGQQQAEGILIFGVNPCQRLDEEYEDFYKAVANNVMIAIQNAKIHEEEKKRIEELARLDKAKTDFFNNVSHEFRTPLTLILGMLDCLFKEHKDSLLSAQIEQLNLIRRNTLRLLKLVNSLLDFSSIEADRMQLAYESSKLSQLTTEIVSGFRSLFEKGGLELNTNIAELDEDVYVDQSMYEKILSNLLSNAFKFTTKGSVTVTLKKVGNNVELSVRDTGIGIPQTELHRVFKRFERIETSHARSFEGTGIGLSFVSELVNLHNGTIKVQSQYEQGSIFTVTLPLGTAHIPANKLTTNLKRKDNQQFSTASVQEAEAWLPNVTRQRPDVAISTGVIGNTSTDNLAIKETIVLVDDHKDMRDFVAKILTPYYNVITAENGEIALSLIQTHLPDLIISDAMMPVMTGYQLLKALRSDIKTKGLMFMFLTALSAEEDIVKGLAAGANDYLVKPFYADLLLARVKTLIELSRLQKNLQQQIDQRTAELQKEKENYSILASNIPVGVAHITPAGIVSYANKALCDIIGLPEEAIKANKWMDAIHPDDRKSVLDSWDTARENGTIFISKEFRYVHANNDIVWVNTKIIPEIDEHGKVKSFIAAVVDLTERRRLEHEHLNALQTVATYQQKRAEDAEFNRKQLEEISSMLCHELRNPLSGIQGNVELLDITLAAYQDFLHDKAHLFLPHEQSYIDKKFTEFKDSILAIRRCVEHETIIANDMLDFSKLGAGNIKLHLVDYSLTDTLEAVVKMFQAQAQQRNIQLNIDLPETEIFIKGDSLRLKQVIINIFSNAIKFINQGSISLSLSEIAAKESSSIWQITLADTGIGMDEAEKNMLFQRYAQGSSSTFYQYGGSGLGLFLSKRFIELMNGNIQVESIKGQGSKFIITFEAPHAKKPITNPTISNSPHILFDKANKPKELNNYRILLAEDNQMIQQVIQKLLNKLGYNCETASDGYEVLDKLKKSDFDLIFMDIQMPRKNGIETTITIREDEKLLNKKPVTIIGLSGDALKEQVEKAINIGMDDYITKPATLEKLNRIITYYQFADKSEKKSDNSLVLV